MPTQLVNSTEQINSRTLGGRMFLPFGVYANAPPITANGSIPYAATVDRTMTLIKWAQTVYVDSNNSGNDGSNYWTIALVRIADVTTVNSINTSAISAVTYTLFEDSTWIDAVLTSSHKGIVVYCTKTGTPGDLYLYGPLVEVNI